MHEGLCPYCNLTLTLNDGKLPNHYYGGNNTAGNCYGSDKISEQLVINNELIPNIRE